MANIETECETIIITEEEAGERLDKILALRFASQQSRTYFQYLMEEELVLLNGQPVKKRIKPVAGDEIEIQFALSPEIQLTPEAIPLDVIYEDEHLLVVNKPPGMVVHPAPGNWSGTFVNALLHHCLNQHTSLIDEFNSKTKRASEHLRPGIVHRLDKDTSGLLVAAKTALAHQRLVALFSSRKIYKQYVAICVGNPGTMDIETFIGRHPINRKLMAVTTEEKGKRALTHCQALKYDGYLSAVSLVLATGRTHQIRVHMKHRGTPVLGDTMYGSAQSNQKHQAKRQMLHAQLLRFEHPITGKALEFEVDIPEDMKHIIDRISSLSNN